MRDTPAAFATSRMVTGPVFTLSFVKSAPRRESPVQTGDITSTTALAISPLRNVPDRNATDPP
ncbi:MAG: hypothetical protein K5905_14000 [Roseibium sp.]|uniref:hypothetical protein n=1 Tax=Roseibium sp. TaxID=1936156 RepID=UPI0026227451|nr:hypothetical protein [Roseibium sp.]MCV0426577.1 hypothetical protein [Roseibium sp.]